MSRLLAALGVTPAMLAARGLRIIPDASDLLVVQTDPDGRTHQLTPAAADAWHAMRDAAGGHNIQLHVASAFRSAARQAEIIQRKLTAGQSAEDIARVSAPPGYSEHHSGRAVDICTPDCPALETCFDQTPAFEWLTAHAGRFGFSLSYPRANTAGYAYEPWHWCWSPNTLSAD